MSNYCQLLSVTLPVSACSFMSCGLYIFTPLEPSCGRPCTTWLRAIDTDVQSVNIGIHSAWRKATDRTLWRRIVDTATLHHGGTWPLKREESHCNGCVRCRALMFAASKFGRRLPAVKLQEQDIELLSHVNVELQQYIDNMDHVKSVDCIPPLSVP